MSQHLNIWNRFKIFSFMNFSPESPRCCLLFLVKLSKEMPKCCHICYICSRGDGSSSSLLSLNLLPHMIFTIKTFIWKPRFLISRCFNLVKSFFFLKALFQSTDLQLVAEPAYVQVKRWLWSQGLLMAMGHMQIQGREELAEKRKSRLLWTLRAE